MFLRKPRGNREENPSHICQKKHGMSSQVGEMLHVPLFYFRKPKKKTRKNPTRDIQGKNSGKPGLRLQ